MAFELFIPTEDENRMLDSLPKTYAEVSEMSKEEREFLNAIVLRKKPKKLLELGVSAGASSVIMLNAIKDTEAQLSSIDYSKEWYCDKTKNTGYMADSYPDLKSKWKLFTGGLALNFMEEIGGGIDFCFIDTVHDNPGEILDTLMVLPFLKDDALIVFHDVNYQTMSGKYTECDPVKKFTNNLLLSAINGKKYVQGNFVERSCYNNIDDYAFFPNIGAIQIDGQTKKSVFEIFNLLTLKWTYLLSREEEESIIKFFSKYYDDYFVRYITKVFLYHRECFAANKTIPFPKFITNLICCFIPSKAKKSAFRRKIGRLNDL